MERFTQNIQQIKQYNHAQNDEKEWIFEQYFMLLKLFKQIKFIQQQESTQKNQLLKQKQQNLLFNYKLFGIRNQKKYIRWQRYWFYQLIKQLTHTYNPDVINFEENIKQFMNFLLQKQLEEDQTLLVKREYMVEQNYNFGISCGKYYKFYDSLPTYPFFCVTIKSIDQRFKIQDDSSGVLVLLAKNFIGQILYVSFFTLQHKSNSLIIFSRFVKQQSLMIILDEVQYNNSKVSQRCLDLLKLEKVDFIYIPISQKKEKNPIFSQKISSSVPSQDYYINLLIHFNELQKDDEIIFKNQNLTEISIIKQIVKLNYSKTKSTKSKQFQEFIKDEIKEIQFLKKHNEERINHHFPEKQDRSRKCKHKNCKKKSIYRCIGCSIKENESISLCVLCFKSYHDNILKQKGKEGDKTQSIKENKTILKSQKQKNILFVKEQEESPSYNQAQNFAFQLKLPETFLLKMGWYFNKVQKLQNSYLNAIKKQSILTQKSRGNQSQNNQKSENKDGNNLNFQLMQQNRQLISNSNSNSNLSQNVLSINKNSQQMSEQGKRPLSCNVSQELIASSLRSFKILGFICQQQQI